MKIFYDKTTGMPGVPSESPVEVPLEVALAVFRGLDPKSGFLGIQLSEQFTMQFAYRKNGKVRIELLDTSIPAFDSCVTHWLFGEQLIRAAADNQDVFQIARSSNYEWEHTNLR